MLFRIEAQLLTVSEDGWSQSTQIPTFYVGPEQGCETAAHALRVAAKVVLHGGPGQLSASAYCEEFGEYASLAFDGTIKEASNYTPPEDRC